MMNFINRLDYFFLFCYTLNIRRNIMILDNVKERLSQAKENIDFIKECL